MRTFIGLIAIGASAVSCLNPAGAAVFYPLSNEFGYDLPSGLSPDGSIVVTSRHVWTPSGGFVDISPADSELYSRDISNTGVIAGLWCGPNTGSCYEAFRATVGAPIQGLGAFDNWASDAFAITTDGSVLVGNSSSPTGTQAFRWTSATGLVGLGNLAPNVNSHDAAYGVSADGAVVVGQSGDDMVLEAFRWTAATGMVGLGDFAGGSVNSSAQAVSSDGQVIVGFGTDDAGLQAFRWTGSTGLTSLGNLPGGSIRSMAYGVTASGDVIVGEAHSDPSTNHAFIWTAAGGMRKLQDVLVAEYGLATALAGWTLTVAADISDDGNVIVGYGYDPTGKSLGFVVIIPEPRAIALGVIGVLALACRNVRSNHRRGPIWRSQPRPPRQKILVVREIVGPD